MNNRFHLAPSFDNDKTKDGWKLVSDSDTKEGDFEPELAELLREGENYVIGEELLKRVPEGFGQRHAEAMLRNQAAIPVKWRKYLLVFTNTFWQNQKGYRCVAYLTFGGKEEWYLDFRWIDGSFNSGYRVVRPRKK